MVSKYKVGDVVTARAGFNDYDYTPELTFEISSIGQYHERPMFHTGEKPHQCRVLFWSEEIATEYKDELQGISAVWECFIIDDDEPEPNDSEPVITKKEVYAHVNPLLPDVTHWELTTLPPKGSDWWDNDYTSYGGNPPKHTNCKRVNIQKYTIEYRTEIKP